MSKQKEIKGWKETRNEKDYEFIQKYLQQEMLRNRPEYIRDFVKGNKDSIKDIYHTYGSANEYLRVPYNSICFDNPKLALYYQELM
jgi:hypothetical protein